MQKVGAIIFDQEKIGKTGWAAVAGEEAKRIQGIHQISHDVVWLTNVDYNSFRNLNFSKINCLRESHFLRIRVNSLLKELDLQNNAKKAAETVANIFGRVATFGKERFNIDVEEYSYRYPNLIASKIIPPELKKAPSMNGEAIMDNLKNATQLLQNTLNRKSTQNKQPITVSMPRVAYNRYLTSLQYPVEREWQPIKFKDGSFDVGVDKKGDIIEGTKTRMGKLKKLAESNSFLFNVEVKGYIEEYSYFTMFGVGRGQDDESRKWATFPEIAEMIKYSHVTILKGLKTESGKLDHELLDKDPSTNFSYSKGIFLENMVNALSTAIDKNHNGIIPYLRAYDRAACFRLAEVLHQENYQIMSYGMGNVTVLVSKNKKDMDEFIGKCLSLGALPEIKHLNQIMPDEIDVEDTIIDNWMPEGLSTFVNEDWLYNLIRTTVPSGLFSTKMLMDIDDILDQPASEQGPLLEDFIKNMVANSEKISEEKREKEGSSQDIFNDDDIEELDI